jgi:hypothetical protein
MVNTKEIKIDIPEGYEIDKENSTFECIKFKKKVNSINTWKDIEYLSGYFINNQASIIETPEILRVGDDKNVFVSKKYAKAALALAQISQLMPYYGGEITEEWKNEDWKFTVNVDAKGEINLNRSLHIKELIAFHTKTQRDKFLSFPENVQLVKDLFMVG